MRWLYGITGIVAMVFALAFAIGAGGPNPEARAGIRDFGAMGDGKADDTAAIQKAIDAGIGQIGFPTGVYRLTRPLVIDLDRAGFTALDGGGTARLVMAGPGPAVRFMGTHEGTADPGGFKPNVWDRQRAPQVVGLEILNVWRNSAGLLIEDGRRINLTNCSILDCDGVGLLLRNVSQSRVSGCLIRDDRPGHADSVPLKLVGGKGNLVASNLVRGRMAVDPGAATLEGNVEQE